MDIRFIQWLSLIASVYSPLATMVSWVRLSVTKTKYRNLFILICGLLLFYAPIALYVLLAFVVVIMICLEIYQQMVYKKCAYSAFVVIPMHPWLRKRVERLTGIKIDSNLYEMHWNKRGGCTYSLRELVKAIRTDCKQIAEDFGARHWSATVVSTLYTTSIADIGLRPVVNYFKEWIRLKGLAPRGMRMERKGAEWETRVWGFTKGENVYASS